MLTKNKIIDVWKNQGWNNVSDYYNDLNLHKQYTVDLLDPDKISPKAFWKATDKWFNTDTVCNGYINKTNSSSISQANYTNNKIAQYSGMLGLVSWGINNCDCRFGKTIIGEIGCGYGSFYEHFARDKHVDYLGFDVVKRFDKCVEVKGKDGTFTNKQIEEYNAKINLFYSCNVFQHLSPKKIKKYMSQMHRILPYSGHAVLAYINSEYEGTSYHYGQTVPLMPIKDFYKLCEDTGFTIETKIEQNIWMNKTFNLACVFLTKYNF